MYSFLQILSPTLIDILHQQEFVGLMETITSAFIDQPL